MSTPTIQADLSVHTIESHQLAQYFLKKITQDGYADHIHFFIQKMPDEEDKTKRLFVQTTERVQILLKSSEQDEAVEQMSIEQINEAIKPAMEAVRKDFPHISCTFCMEYLEPVAPASPIRATMKTIHDNIQRFRQTISSTFKLKR